MVDASTIFLVVFVVSFVLTILSFVLGVADLSIGGHGIGHGDAPHPSHLPTVHLPHELHLGGHGAGGPGLHIGAHDAVLGAEGISPFNMATMLAFLTWFGGAGYLLTTYTGVATLLALVLAGGVGLAGAALVFTFMVRVLLPGQTPYMKSDDYEMVGTIGRLSVGIRPSGTGELIYSKAGGRQVCSARTEDGQPLERGAEVVIVRHEGPIAYVELFDSFLHSDTPENVAPASAGGNP